MAPLATCLLQLQNCLEHHLPAAPAKCTCLLHLLHLPAAPACCTCLRHFQAKQNASWQPTPVAISAGPTQVASF